MLHKKAEKQEDDSQQLLSLSLPLLPSISLSSSLKSNWCRHRRYHSFSRIRKLARGRKENEKWILFAAKRMFLEISETHAGKREGENNSPLLELLDLHHATLSRVLEPRFDELVREGESILSVAQVVCLSRAYIVG